MDIDVKISQQNFSKLKSPKGPYIMIKWFYPRDARMIQNLQMNQCNTPH